MVEATADSAAGQQLADPRVILVLVSPTEFVRTTPRRQCVPVEVEAPGSAAGRKLAEAWAFLRELELRGQGGDVVQDREREQAVTALFRATGPAKVSAVHPSARLGYLIGRCCVHCGVHPSARLG